MNTLLTPCKTPGQLQLNLLINGHYRHVFGLDITVFCVHVASFSMMEAYISVLHAGPSKYFGSAGKKLKFFACLYLHHLNTNITKFLSVWDQSWKIEIYNGDI